MKELNFRLDGKVALITGSGRGIGLGIGRALAAQGCAVALQDIEHAVAVAEAERIVSEGGRAIGLAGDASDLAWPERWVKQTVKELGGLSILVNNAAIQTNQHWLQLTAGEIERQYRTNVTSPILLAQQAVGIFREQRWGRIINVGSIQQKEGNPHMLAYSSGKLALQNITKAWARDLGKDGITANLLSPGWFNTYRNRDTFKTQRDLDEKGQWIPVPRIGEPEDAAGLAVFLSTDHASYITGQTIFVDGGMSAR